MQGRAGQGKTQGKGGRIDKPRQDDISLSAPICLSSANEGESLAAAVRNSTDFAMP